MHNKSWVVLCAVATRDLRVVAELVHAPPTVVQLQRPAISKGSLESNLACAPVTMSELSTRTTAFVKAVESGQTSDAVDALLVSLKVGQRLCVRRLLLVVVVVIVGLLWRCQ